MNQLFKIDDGKERHYGLDFMRFIAIVSVILYHFPRGDNDLIIRALSHYGYLGVDIFFVLSGFLIGGQTFSKLSQGKEFKIIDFCIRRFYRTLPNYYIILIIWMALLGVENFSWKYFFFLQNFDQLTYFSHSWSLCIEEHFYILFPLCILFITRFKKMNLYPVTIGALILITIWVRFILWKNIRPDLVYSQSISEGFKVYFRYFFYPTYSRLDGIAVGTLLAYIKYFKPSTWDSWVKRPHLFLTIFLFLFTTISVLSWTKVKFFASVFSYSGYAICFGFFLISVISEKSIINKIKMSFIRPISILSYSLYLTHGFVIWGGQNLLKSINMPDQFWIIWVLIYPASVALSYLLYITVEKPVLKFRNLLLKNK